MAFGAAAYAVGSPVRLTSSGVVAGGTAMARTYAGGSGNPASVAETTALPGCILGFWCNSTTAGTVAISTNNGGVAGTSIIGTITPTAGTFYNIPLLSPNGIFATIANTLDVTFFVIE